MSCDPVLRIDDTGHIRVLVEEAGVFRPEEVDVACELASDALSGDPSYRFLLWRGESGAVDAYSCYGEIPITDGRFDLYWIVVSPRLQGQGIGAQLLRETESAIRTLGGGHVYAETSGLPNYTPARRFYEASGFTEAARLSDFYREGDDKIIYRKLLAQA